MSKSSENPSTPPRVSVPWYARTSLTVVLIAVGFFGLLACRAFFAEPFRIPADSMQPTLASGDFIFVDKASYGWNVPFEGSRMRTFAAPRRGDVAVLRWPSRPTAYVKRVVGVPGDTVAYIDKRLVINGREQPVEPVGGASVAGQSVRYTETLDGVRHEILLFPGRPPYVPSREFPGRENCRFDAANFTCNIPDGQYFVLGDSRDNSKDSRDWGFVPEDLFLGKVTMIWSSRDSERVGRNVR